MTLEVFVGRNALPTASTGTTDLTSPDSTTVPDGVLHNNSAAITDGNSANDFVMNIGMADGATERAMSTTVNSSTTNDDATKGYYGASVAMTVPGNQSTDGALAHNSFIAGGQRLDNTNGFVNAYLCHSMFFAGCDVTVKEVILNATVDTKVTVDPGHAWDLVLVTLCQETVLNDADADNNGSFGFMVKADDAQACFITGQRNATSSPGNPVVNMSNVYSGAIINELTGAITVGVDVQDGTTGDECDIFPRLAGGQSVLVALTFIGFTTGESAKIVTWDTPTAIGNNSITGAGGVPLALIHLISRATDYDTAKTGSDAGTYGISLITPDSQFCTSSVNEDATGTTSDCRNLSNSRSIRVLRDDFNSGTLNTYGSDYVSMDADGWTENWTHVENAAAGKCISLAFLPSVASSENLSMGGVIIHP